MNVITDIASQGLTRALAEQARTLSYADLPDDVRTLARQCVLDYVACTLAGAKEELTDILLAEMQEQGGAPIATVIGHSRAPAGAVGRAGEWRRVARARLRRREPGDDRPSVGGAAVGAARAGGGARQFGRDVLTAFVAGYELQCRLGLLLAPGHYNVLGFHATGTLGSFGAAAACAHLLGLDAEQVRHRARHRRHPGGGAEVDVRHHVQAAACRQGGVSRAARRTPGAARLHQPRRRAGMRAGLRPHAQPRLQSGRARWPSRRAASTSATTSSSTTPPAT